jgi:hypothetical protein
VANQFAGRWSDALLSIDLDTGIARLKPNAPFTVWTDYLLTIPAVVYSNRTKTATISSLTTDSAGQASFYAVPGIYYVRLSEAGITREIRVFEDIDDTADVDALATVVSENSQALQQHEVDTTNVHGVSDTSQLETQSGAQSKASAAQSAAIAAAATDATTKANAALSSSQAYTDTQLGLRPFKDPVRVVATTNINLSAPGSGADTVALTSGDSWLLVGQTTASQNGIYVYNGSASPTTRRSDADTSPKVKSGLLVIAQEGTSTNRDKVWELQTDAPIVLGTTALTFGQASGDTTGLATQSALTSETTRAITAEGTKRNRYTDQGAAKTASYAMSVWDRSTYDLTSGPVTQSLPASPMAGDEVQVYLSATANSNALTITGTGGPFTLSYAGFGVTILWTGSAWVETQDRKTLSSLVTALTGTLGSPNNPVTNAAATRPTGLSVVYWTCSTQPTNWVSGDLWINNS